MPKVKNKTDKEVCIRTGRNQTDYVFHFIPPKGSIEVNNEQYLKIAQIVKNTGRKDVSLTKRLKVKKQKVIPTQGKPTWEPVEDRSKKA